MCLEPSTQVCSNSVSNYLPLDPSLPSGSFLLGFSSASCFQFSIKLTATILFSSHIFIFFYLALNLFIWQPFEEMSLLLVESAIVNFHLLLSAVQRQLIHLMPGCCSLCQCASTTCIAGYCRYCLHALPRNKVACQYCALPLTALPIKGDGMCCARCLRHPRFKKATVPLLYAGNVPALIHAFKFHAALPAATVLAELLNKAFHPRPASWLLIVPQHPDRARQRGFDHIDWLASLCPSLHTLPRVTAYRSLNTPPLRHLNRRQRLALMKKAFSIKTSLVQRHIVLLDDVMTTGATLNALARLCLQHGAASVEVLAVARTPPSAWNMLNRHLPSSL